MKDTVCRSEIKYVKSEAALRGLFLLCPLALHVSPASAHRMDVCSLPESCHAAWMLAKDMAIQKAHHMFLELVCTKLGGLELRSRAKREHGIVKSCNSGWKRWQLTSSLRDASLTSW